MTQEMENRIGCKTNSIYLRHTRKGKKLPLLAVAIRALGGGAFGSRASPRALRIPATHGEASAGALVLALTSQTKMLSSGLSSPAAMCVPYAFGVYLKSGCGGTGSPSSCATNRRRGGLVWFFSKGRGITHSEQKGAFRFHFGNRRFYIKKKNKRKKGKTETGNTGSNQTLFLKIRQ